MQRRPHALLDAVSLIFGVKTDLELADRLLFSAGSVSRIRKGTQPVSSDLVLKIHLRTQLPVSRIMDLLQEEKTRRVHRANDKDD